MNVLENSKETNDKKEKTPIKKAEQVTAVFALNPYPFKSCFKTGAFLTGTAHLVGLVFSAGITYAMMESQSDVFASQGLFKQILFFAWMSFSFLGLFSQWFYVVPLLLIGVSAWPIIKYKSFGGFILGILAVSGAIFILCLAISIITIWFGSNPQ